MSRSVYLCGYVCVCGCLCEGCACLCERVFVRVICVTVCKSICVCGCMSLLCLCECLFEFVNVYVAMSVKVFVYSERICVFA